MQKQSQQMLAQEQLDLRELEDKERDLLQLEVSDILSDFVDQLFCFY